MMDQETRRKLRMIGVPEAVEALDMMEGDPSSYAEMGFDEKMRFVVDYVAQEKENASVKRLLQRAHLRIPEADIYGVVYDGRPLSREKVLTLGTCQFAESSTDVIVTGFTGTGKTSLSCAIAKQACKNRLPTPCVRMPDLIMAYEEAVAAGVAEAKLLRKHSRFKVMVVDD